MRAKLLMRGKMLVKSASIVLILFITACSSAPVETQYYLLRQEKAPQTRALVASEDFALGKVEIATYIDQPGMVLEVGPGQIHPALHHQWAEPMRQGVRYFLQREISAALGKDLFPKALSDADTIIEIRVDQLHGTSDGQAVILAYWWLKKDGQIKSPHQFGETSPLARDGYEALAKAERALLRGLAASIAKTLKASS
jgi:uncharacterized lipoprotein YmbA